MNQLWINEYLSLWATIPSPIQSSPTNPSPLPVLSTSPAAGCSSRSKPVAESQPVPSPEIDSRHRRDEKSPWVPTPIQVLRVYGSIRNEWKCDHLSLLAALSSSVKVCVPFTWLPAVGCSLRSYPGPNYWLYLFTIRGIWLQFWVLSQWWKGFEGSKFFVTRISSSEFRKVLSPRQRLGVFNAQTSRHVRSLGDQACSRGFSVTWDPMLDRSCRSECTVPKKKTEKIVRVDQKWTKRQNECSPFRPRYTPHHEYSLGNSTFQDQISIFTTGQKALELLWGKLWNYLYFRLVICARSSQNLVTTMTELGNNNLINYKYKNTHSI